MKKLNKTIALLLSLAITLLLFSSCGKKPEKTEEKTTKPDVVVITPDDVSTDRNDETENNNAEEETRQTETKNNDGTLSVKFGDMIYDCPAFSLFYEYLVYTANANLEITKHAVMKCQLKDETYDGATLNMGIIQDSESYFGMKTLEKETSYFVIAVPEESLDNLEVSISCEEANIEDRIHISIVDKEIKTTNIFENDDVVVEKCYIEQDVFDDVCMFMKITAKTQKVYLSVSDISFDDKEFEETYASFHSDELSNGKNTLTLEAGTSAALNMPFITDYENSDENANVKGKLAFTLSYAFAEDGEKMDNPITVNIDEPLEKTSF